MDVVPGEKRIAAVVYNPIKVDLPKLKKSVNAAAKTAGWGRTLWLETDEHDFGAAATAKALAKGADVVMAAGGDGTVRAVAEGLRGSGVPIALLPSGTGNLLARNLDFSVTKLDETIAVAFADSERRIDLGIVELTREDGTVEEKAFLVMAGFGLDAKMMANTRPELKKAVGWLAYVDGGVRALAEIKPVELTFRINGGPERTIDVLTLLVGNCGALPGGLLLMPDALPDDGILDVVAIRPRGPFGWAKVWRKIAWENGVLRKSAVGRKIIDLSRDVKDVRYNTGRLLEARLESAQEVELDGDEFGTAIKLRAWTDHLGLTVKVPADVAHISGPPARESLEGD